VGPLGGSEEFSRPKKNDYFESNFSNLAKAIMNPLWVTAQKLTINYHHYENIRYNRYT
jgi:hypothetical protein